MTAKEPASIWPLLIYFLSALFLVGAMLWLSYFLGERHKERGSHEIYESGIAPLGTARLRLDVKFYLVAVFFVIFDLESVFIIAWAAAVRESGWRGFAVISLFIITLLVALLYVWMLGGLDWSSKRIHKRGRVQ